MRNTFTELMETSPAFRFWITQFKNTANFYQANGQSHSLFDNDGNPTPLVICLAYAFRSGMEKK